MPPDPFTPCDAVGSAVPYPLVPAAVVLPTVVVVVVVVCVLNGASIVVSGVIVAVVTPPSSSSVLLLLLLLLLLDELDVTDGPVLNAVVALTDGAGTPETTAARAPQMGKGAASRG